MHYDGDAFLTQEAWEAGLSSMTYKGKSITAALFLNQSYELDKSLSTFRKSSKCF